MLSYSATVWADALQIEFRNSVQKLNERNAKLFSNSMQPYATFPALSAAMAIIVMILLLDIVTLCAIIFTLNTLILNA
jgi:hypothetical protein